MTDSSEIQILPCVCANLRRASRAVTMAYDDALRPHGIKATQFTLLQTLDSMGEVSQSRLGERLALDITTLTRNLRHLEEAGWLRSRAGEDRRKKLWKLTAAGKRKYKSARTAWQKAQRRLKRRLNKKAGQLEKLLADATVAAQD